LDEESEDDVILEYAEALGELLKSETIVVAFNNKDMIDSNYERHTRVRGGSTATKNKPW
jgi:hypothetical protein